VRIGLVCPYSLSIPGGVQAQVLGLARVLRRRGHEARVLGPCDGPPPEPMITPLGDSIPTAANGSMAPLAPDPAAALRTIRVIRDEDFDVLHLHEPLAPGPTLTALILHAAPTVATFHAAGRSSSYRWLNPLVRRLAQRIDVRCAVSKDAVALAQSHLGGTYELLYNGIDEARFALAEPWKTDDRAVMFVGRHEERKGLAVLLDAASDLPPDVRIWVASDGPQTAELRAAHRADGRIEWLGRITEEEKIARLRAARVACFPSLHGESFGVVLLEAMAAGTPVVASDLAGYRNVATHGADALLVPPGDPRALAHALDAVLADDLLSAHLRAGGDQRVDAFSMGALADRYLDLYAEASRIHRRRAGTTRPVA
jgi:phosphatidyl-myo-inositol alpha-mannosyltransferase